MPKPSFMNLPRLLQGALESADHALLHELFYELRQYEENYPTSWRHIQAIPAAHALLRAIEDAYYLQVGATYIVERTDVYD